MSNRSKATSKMGEATSVCKTEKHSVFRRWLAKKMFGRDHYSSMRGQTTAADDITVNTVGQQSSGDHGDQGQVSVLQKTKTINVTTIQSQRIHRTNALCGFKDLRRPGIPVAKGRNYGKCEDWSGEFGDYYSSRRAYLDDDVDAAILVKYSQDATATHPASPQPKFDAETAVRPYHIRGLLGSGSHGVIFLVSKAGKEFVAKLASKDVFIKMTMNEFIMIKDLRHSNIVRALGPAKGGFIMEHVDTDVLTRFESCNPNCDQMHRIVAGIIKGLGYLHCHKIAHLDLKLENILLDKRWNPKIADFGISERFQTRTGEQVKLHECLGTPPYMAPELLRFQRDSSRGMLMPPIDVWACGCLVYEILTGDLPFGIDNNVKVIEANQRRMAGHGLPVPPRAAEELRNNAKTSLLFTVAQKMLQILPSQRPSAALLVSTYFRRH